MVGRIGVGAGPEVELMTVMSLLDPDLGLTNCAYCFPADLNKFVSPGSKHVLVLIMGSIVLTLRAHRNIPSNHIALNSTQRLSIGVKPGDQIPVNVFLPPDNFKLALLNLELESHKGKTTRPEQLDAEVLDQHLLKNFIDQVMAIGQRVSFEFCGTNYIFTVNQALLEGQDDSKGLDRGMISTETYFVFEATPNSGIKIVNQENAASSKIFHHGELNLQNLGIGGLDSEFNAIFRRAFASRLYRPHFIEELGIKHVKGMLLYGPPGTGKTLLARQIGKLLNGKEPKIVNGPEVLSKYVGETEKNVRDLFADAENDQRTRGKQSDLHVIIFDEIDAICKSRGSIRDGTGVHDSIVNQLMTKMDGVESLNNVLLIGITNRKDLLDKALLRPGCLEVHVEFNLPDENGRLQILQIHTNKMKESFFLAADVSLEELAARTTNYSGAELEGVVKNAVSFALNRQRSMDDLTKPVDKESINVTMDDFLHALHEIIPALSGSIDDLQRFRLNGIVDCGKEHMHIRERAMLLVKHVKVSQRCPLVTCLLEGPSGSGKTAMAATIGIQSNFPFVKIISEETMMGLSEGSKCAQIVKVFEDAYRSQLSIIILDDIERLLDYGAIGPHYSNLISQALLVLLQRRPPKGKKLLVIGTSSNRDFLESLGMGDAFSVTYHVPKLNREDAKKVLQGLNVFAEHDLDSAVEKIFEQINEISIKKLYRLVEMAAQGLDGKSGDAVRSGKEKIDISHFYEIL